jgi:hypothetical protein
VNGWIVRQRRAGGSDARHPYGANAPARRNPWWYEHCIGTRSTTLTEEGMGDDLSNRGGQERSRISLAQEYEVRYWTGALSVTKEQLAEAVKQVGNSEDKVREYFTSRKR